MYDEAHEDDLVPITERASSTTRGLDIASAGEKFDIMARAELEVFGGPFGAGLRDETFLHSLLTYVGNLNGESSILLAGAGTSGRLCRLVTLAHTKNRVHRTRLVFSCVAGGTRSLWRAAPLAEDHRDDGIADFRSLWEHAGSSQACVIGVTCGLSAAYIEGFLAGARTTSVSTAVIGFNHARHRRVNLFIESSPPTQLFNPIIGPEPVAGSVRMKGGTATIIILFIVLDLLAERSSVPTSLLEKIEEYTMAIVSLERHRSLIAEVMEQAGHSIVSGGRIFLLGTGLFGALCIFDAAECPPTFGAERHMCQGFAEAGWEILTREHQTPDAKYLPDEISFAHFARQILPGLNKNDTVVFVCEANAIDRTVGLLDAIRRSPASSSLIVTGRADGPIPTSWPASSIDLRDEVKRDECQLLAVRSLLNRISTGAFAIAGKLYTNRMIDVRITNRKLFHRAASIVASLVPTDLVTAANLVIRSIGTTSSVFIRADQVPDDSLVNSAANRRYVVPRAILMGRFPHVSMGTIDEWLKREPVIRKLIQDRSSSGGQDVL